MSIEDAIVAAARSGRLTEFTPTVPWAARRRVFLMSDRLIKHLQSFSESDAAAFARSEALRADISHFVEGGFINWTLMKWLDPKKYEHWELRSTRPAPSLRVFGRFAKPDVFVGTHMEARKNLRGKWDLDWEIEKLVCEEIWESVLPSQAPFIALRYEEYITENAAKDLKVMS